MPSACCIWEKVKKLTPKHLLIKDSLFQIFYSSNFGNTEHMVRVSAYTLTFLPDLLNKGHEKQRLQFLSEPKTRTQRLKSNIELKL